MLYEVITKVRYQPKVIAGRAGASGINTARSQNPFNASPVCTQAGLESFPIPEEIQVYPT